MRPLTRREFLVGATALAGAAAAVGSATGFPWSGDDTVAKSAGVRSFRLSERFGVSHPTQLVDFEIDHPVDRALSYVVDDTGTEVPHQLLENNTKLAIQTDLRANQEREFTFRSGRPPIPAVGGVTLIRTAEHYEVTNGLTGVRVPVSSGGGDKTLAPVQGILYPDGTWTATGPSYVTTNVTGHPAALSLSTTVVEDGPLKVVLLVSYTYRRPEFSYAHATPPIMTPAGDGHHTTRVEVQAGQPSILFTEDTDMDLEYSLNVSPGLHPTQARWRGYDASDIEFGFEHDAAAKKIQYRTRLDRKSGLDALYDLKFDRDYPTSHSPSSGIKRLSTWSLYPQDTGWYWQMYNSNPTPPTDNLIGIFAGRASQLSGAHHSGVGFYTKKLNGTSSGEAGITFQANRLGPDNRYAPRVTLSWALFTGTRSRHLLAPEELQPIGSQLNLHSGMNLNRIGRIPADFPDPPRGFGGIYMDTATTGRMMARVQADPAKPEDGKPGSYAGYLYLADPESLDLLKMWQDQTPATAEALAGRLTEGNGSEPTSSSRYFLNTLVNGDGVYDFDLAYWKFPLTRLPLATWMDQILAHPQLSAATKARVKATLSLYSHIMWDDDFAPLTAIDVSGAGYGTENMAYMVRTGRSFFAALLSTAPTMKSHFDGVVAATKKSIDDLINDSGAEIGSVHYTEASIGTTLHTALQIKMRGHDLFATERKLTAYAAFYMNLLTPPEPRFGESRKLLAIGDGSTESTTMLGKLASGFASANPDLSAILMDAWRSNGKRHDNFFGSSLLMIDEDAPAKPLRLGPANFPGYYSVLRNSAGTDKETALWMVDGDWYRDHRHDDQGSLVLYALGAPLMVDWGSLYTPRVARSYMHSMIVRETDLRDGKDAQIPWNQDGIPLEVPATAAWVTSQQADTNGYLTLPNSSYAHARFNTRDGLVWHRRIGALHPNEDFPILLITDSFEGAHASSAKISTLNLMAGGEVHVRGGTFDPLLRSDANGELPSAGQAFPLDAGLNRLSFTGQSFGTAAQGIDWDLYTFSIEAQQALLGNWAHTWHPSREASEFSATNGRPFEERQHILRVRGTGPLTAIVLPHRKTQPGPAASLSQKDGMFTAVRGAETTTFSSRSYSFASPAKTVLTSYDAEPVTTNGYSISGGPTEVSVSASSVAISAHGTNGVRRMRFPGSWELPSSVSRSGDVYSFEYRSDDGRPVTLTGTGHRS